MHLRKSLSESPKVPFTSKGGGGQTSSFEFWEYANFKLAQIFVFDSNFKFFKRAMKCDQIFHPADFWIPRPYNLPEISFAPPKKIFFFSALR